MSKIPISKMILGKIFQKKAIYAYLVVKLCLIIGFVLFISSSSSLAQKISYPKHQFGIGYSSFSGSGLNYQIEISKFHALQFSLLPIYLSSNSDELEINGILGGEYQFTFTRNDASRFFVFSGTSVQHLENRLTSTRIVNDLKIVETKINTNRIYNFGLGLGLEYKPHPRFAISAGIGLLYQVSEKSTYSEFWDRNPSGDSFLGIGGSLSLKYVF